MSHDLGLISAAIDVMSSLGIFGGLAAFPTQALSSYP